MAVCPPRKRKLLLFVVLVVPTLLLLNTFYIYIKRVLHPARVFNPWTCDSNEFTTNLASKADKQACHEKGTKRILFYTTWFRRKPWPYIGSTESFLADCPSKKCQISYDENDIGKSDLVIFHAGDLHKKVWDEVQQIHKYRCPGQRMAYLTQESVLKPENVRSLAPDGFFNWTITFKRTSDFPIPYGYYLPRYDHPADFIAEEVNYAEGKDKLVAWAVSNCGRTREKYVKELVKHIKVDVYGECSSIYGQNNKCPRYSSRCDNLFRTYKFYLAFENAICTDYITEKFWRTLKWNVVPIVLARDIYDPALVPPGSFISVQDFPSVKALAEYLLYLDKNDTAYNEYFQWRQKFTIGSQHHFRSFACDICEALHDQCVQPKVYQNLKSFWNRTTDCEGRELSLLKLIESSKIERWPWSWFLSFFD